MKFFSLAILTSLLASETLASQVLQARGCTSNTGTHCGESSVVRTNPNIPAALQDLMSQCDNGNFPGGARRVSSGSFGGVVAYACNSFCRTSYIPCQDAEWSLNRVLTGCADDLGWDSQESRGTWFGFANENESPCGFVWTGRGTS